MCEAEHLCAENIGLKDIARSCRGELIMYYSVISLLLPLFSTQKIEEQRRKVLAILTQVHNEEHRHRVKIQTHTQNKEQMLRRSSQVTFVKKIYIKYYFI